MGANTALDLTYTYDVRGKVTNILNGAITGDNRTYAYDGIGRLTSSSGPWGSGTYSYDALGNIRTKTEGGRALVMSYDAKNRLVSHTDTGGPNRTLNYDNRGNVTQLGGLFFTYDKSDQPTYISGTASGTYRYDGHNRRVKAVVDGKTIYNVYDQSGTLVHIDAVTDGKKTDYIGKFVRIKTENGIDTPTYLHMDHLGSAQTGTSQNGTVAWREQYTPFGETMTNPLGNADLAGYTGHIKDSATGLNYMQARYYDPLIGRFLSIDPINFTPDMPFMFNRYTYVNNDPVNGTDPTGMACDGCLGSSNNLRRDGFSPSQARAFQQRQRADNKTGAIIGAAIGSLFLPGPEDVVIGAAIATKVGQAIAGAFKGKKAASGLGDLTKAEVGQIQNVVDEAGRPLDVVGSAARGERRNVGGDLPIGNGAGTRSDTDFTTAGSSRGNFNDLEGGLPNTDLCSKRTKRCDESKDIRL